MRKNLRETVLVLLIILLVGFALIPSRETGTDPESSGPEAYVPREESVRSAEPIESVDQIDQSPFMERVEETVEALDKHAMDVAMAARGIAPEQQRKVVPRSRFSREEPAAVPGMHPLWPLVPGTEWLYRVIGPSALVPGSAWTIRIVTEPNENQPGLVELGFENRMTMANVWLDGETVRFEGLPFVEPLELIGSRPVQVHGEFLPNAVRVIEGAVWTQMYTRNVVYTYIDDKSGSRHEMTARATQKDRAVAGRFQTIVTPAGRFGAHRVDWLSRIEIKAGGRQVLEHLTTEPYRQETMWIAPGIGIVKREIDYRAGPEPRGLITIDLIRFYRPDDCVLQDAEL